MAVHLERFDHYMDRCLYGPAGFYTTGRSGQAGSAGRRRGDFLTSPEVGPLFGAVLAQVLVDRWNELDRPEPFVVYDVGCGPGTLLRTVEVALADLSSSSGTNTSHWKLVGVDRVDSPGASIDRLPQDLSSAAVVANELLDNLPFRVLEQTDQGPAEVWVETVFDDPASDGPASDDPASDDTDEAHRPGGRSHEILLSVEFDNEPAGRDLAAALADLPPGTRVPYLERANAWVADVLTRDPAALIVFDYGAATTAELARRGGWLRTYQAHERGDDPLNEAGHWDITCDVAWDQMPRPARLERQHEALRRWGIDALVDEGRRFWQEKASSPDLRALRMRSRSVEAPALLEPAGLGGWWVAIWSRSELEVFTG